MELSGSCITFEDYGNHYQINDNASNVDRTRNTERASKMSWTALPVEPACIGKTDGGRGVRPCSLDWLDRQIIYKHIRRYEY